jgi:hypothetical protein
VDAADFIRIQDAAFRMRHNLAAFADASPKLYYERDTILRHKRYAFANFLSSVNSVQDVVMAVLGKSSEFYAAINAAVQGDEVLHYVRRCRNIEDHARAGLHTPGVIGKTLAGVGFANGQGFVQTAYMRQPFQLYPLPAYGKAPQVPVPTSHCGELLDGAGPFAIALAASTWWGTLSDKVRQDLPALPTAAERSAAVERFHAEMKGRGIKAGEPPLPQPTMVRPPWP